MIREQIGVIGSDILSVLICYYMISYYIFIYCNHYIILTLQGSNFGHALISEAIW